MSKLSEINLDGATESELQEVIIWALRLLVEQLKAENAKLKEMLANF
jgi:hypothetical protein